MHPRPRNVPFVQFLGPWPQKRGPMCITMIVGFVSGSLAKTYLFATAGAVFGVLELLKGLASVVGGVEHGGVLAEDPLLGDEGVHYLLLALLFLQPRPQDRLTYRQQT